MKSNQPNSHWASESLLHGFPLKSCSQPVYWNFGGKNTLHHTPFYIQVPSSKPQEVKLDSMFQQLPQWFELPCEFSQFRTLTLLLGRSKFHSMGVKPIWVCPFGFPVPLQKGYHQKDTPNFSLKASCLEDQLI